MFWTKPSCPACGYEGPDFMFLPHFGMSFSVLVQDRESLALRVVEIPDEALKNLGVLPEGEANQVWLQRVSELADPPLQATERVVPAREFMDAAVQSQPTPAEIPCPGCRAPLHWLGTGIS